MRLSGGEARRLALARACLKDAPILLLDEPAEALDVELEERLDQAITRFSAGRTVLTIAHRLGTAQRAQAVLAFQAGRLAQAGPPAELAAQEGLFKELLTAARGGAPC
jgi:ABC-type multidrug transport system fused ATPase/permease subunit